MRSSGLGTSHHLLRERPDCGSRSAEQIELADRGAGEVAPCPFGGGGEARGLGGDVGARLEVAERLAVLPAPLVARRARRAPAFLDQQLQRRGPPRGCRRRPPRLLGQASATARRPNKTEWPGVRTAAGGRIEWKREPAESIQYTVSLLTPRRPERHSFGSTSGTARAAAGLHARARQVGRERLSPFAEHGHRHLAEPLGQELVVRQAAAAGGWRRPAAGPRRRHDARRRSSSSPSELALMNLVRE